MANTSAVYARIDNELKENAEKILNELGISPSAAIRMFYSQIVLTKSFPLNLSLPEAVSAVISDMNLNQIKTEAKSEKEKP